MLDEGEAMKLCFSQRKGSFKGEKAHPSLLPTHHLTGSCIHWDFYSTAAQSHTIRARERVQKFLRNSQSRGGVSHEAPKAFRVTV